MIFTTSTKSRKENSKSACLNGHENVTEKILVNCMHGTIISREALFFCDY